MTMTHTSRTHTHHHRPHTTAILLAALAIILSPLITHAAPRVIVGGEPLSTLHPPELVRDTLYLPLDSDTTFSLDIETSEIACTDQATTLCLDISHQGATIRFNSSDGRVTIDNTPFTTGPEYFTRGDILFVPAQIFFNALDFKTTYDKPSATLIADKDITPIDFQSRIGDILGITPPPPPTTPETPKTSIEYTYDNTTKTQILRVSGDKSQSSAVELGDYYNQFNIRFLGNLPNGYTLNSTIRTEQTTDPDKKKASLKSLDLSLEKGGITIKLYDIQPAFSNYLMKSYSLQGIDFKRTYKSFSYQLVAGKTPKQNKTSLYSRYATAIRLTHNPGNNFSIGFAAVAISDHGRIIDDLKQNNTTLALDSTCKLDKWTLSTELARSSNDYDSLTYQKTNGTAANLKTEYRSQKISWKTTYEKTGENFFSESSSFTKGKAELTSSFTRKISKYSTLSLGAKSKNLKGRNTKIYPAALSLLPLKTRKNLRLNLKSNFEKTGGPTGRIILKKELQLREKIGINNLDLNLSHQKDKSLAGKLTYGTAKNITLKSSLSDKINTEIKLKNERWKKDRTSITRSSDLTINWEPLEWHSIIIGAGTYYNTPANQRTSLRLALQRVDIVNDTEIRLEIKTDRYRAYRQNEFMLSYSFMK